MFQDSSVKLLQEDLLKIEIFSLRQQVLDLERQLHEAAMIKTYALNEGDAIDPLTGSILRKEPPKD